MTTLLATNDFHSGLVAGRATLEALQVWRQRGAVVIDTGDFFGGCAFHDFSGGAVERRLLSELYDYAVPGNHDLGDVMRVTEQDSFPKVLCANVRPRFPFPGQWAAGELVPGNPAVGLVGFLGRQAFLATEADERAAFEFVDATPGLLRAQCERLRAAGARYIVGLSHTGFRKDVELQQHEALFDLILSGHCHSSDYLWTSVRDGVSCVKGPETGAGYVRVTLPPEGGISITVERPPRGEGGCLPAFVAEAIGKYTVWAGEPVCQLAQGVADRDALAARAAAAVATTFGGCAVLNAGAFRDGLPVAVSRGGLLNAVPFDSPIVRCALDGPLESVVTSAEDRGETPVVHTVRHASARWVYTSRYLATALNLRVEAVEHLTLRSIVTDILPGSTDAIVS